MNDEVQFVSVLPRGSIMYIVDEDVIIVHPDHAPKIVRDGKLVELKPVYG